MFMKSTRLIYQIRSSSLSQLQLAQSKLSHSCRGGKLLSRITRGANIFINVCSAYLQLPPPPTYLWRHQLAEIFWPQIFRSCENRRWNFHGARDVDQREPNEDLARTQCEGSPAHRLLSAGIINAMCRICMQHQAGLAAIVPRASFPSLCLDIMLGRKFFSQILNCRSGINKWEK